MEAETKSMHATFYTLRSRVLTGLEGYHILSTEFETPLHMHDTSEVMLVEDGNLRTTWRRATKAVNSGSVVVMPMGEIHAATAVEGPATVRGVCVSAEAIAEAIRDGAERPLDTTQFGFEALQEPSVAAAWSALHDCLCRSGTRLEQESLLTDACMKLFVERSSAPLVRLGAEHQAVQKAVDHIRASFAADVSLEDLSQVTGLSKFHLIRIFRRAVGVPPHVYLIQMRVAQARKLLREGMAATEAAQTVGFTDLSHLIRHFRKSQGFLPGVYARSVHIPLTKDFRIHGRYASPHRAPQPEVSIADSFG